MYLPDAFRVSDRGALLARASLNPFATVITQGPGGLAVSHLPVLIGPGGHGLCGHLARENPQTAHFAVGAQALAVFHGPHGYVSPSVYGAQPSVPTWNYVVVHARGRARLDDEERLRAIIDAMVEHFDSTAWRLTTDMALLRPMLDAIAGFEIEIEHIEGKWKLSQNRPPDDRRRVVEWLEKGEEPSRALAALMRDHPA